MGWSLKSDKLYLGSDRLSQKTKEKTQWEKPLTNSPFYI
jgi:hypothetical protein